MGQDAGVQALETTATYDGDTGEFVVNTPSDGARKEYIGNAACHGHVAAMFAQLVVRGERYGVHVLVVPIRDQRGKVCDGVRIEDDARWDWFAICTPCGQSNRSAASIRSTGASPVHAARRSPAR